MAADTVYHRVSVRFLVRHKEINVNNERATVAL